MEAKTSQRVAIAGELVYFFRVNSPIGSFLPGKVGDGRKSLFVSGSPVPCPCQCHLGPAPRPKNIDTTVTPWLTKSTPMKASTLRRSTKPQISRTMRSSAWKTASTSLTRRSRRSSQQTTWTRFWERWGSGRARKSWRRFWKRSTRTDPEKLSLQSSASSAPSSSLRTQTLRPSSGSWKQLSGFLFFHFHFEFLIFQNLRQKWGRVHHYGHLAGVDLWAVAASHPGRVGRDHRRAGRGRLRHNGLWWVLWNDDECSRELSKKVYLRMRYIRSKMK